MRRWHHLIIVLGALFLVGAAVQTVRVPLGDASVVEAVLDFVLIAGPGVAMLYIGTWLPRTDITPDLHGRIVGWGLGGVAVIFSVLVLRVFHPGVTVDGAFGTKAITLAVGVLGGLVIGVHEARSTMQTREIEQQYEELKRTRAVEQQNEELRRVRRELEEVVLELERSNERLEQFAYAASHDLQEPLRMVTSYLRLLEHRIGDDLDEESEEYIEFAVDGAERMREMIEGLLAFSRVDTQGAPFDAVDLDAVLDDALSDLRVKVEETDATVTREPLPCVEGDGHQLRQLLQNLLSNALEYADGPPRVHVSAEERSGEWVVSVSDEGIGIDPEQTDRIFTIFQRLHSIEEHDGSGIGLALCKRIVERHGGDIWVESAPGEGSTFYFTLPVASEETAPSTSGTSRSA